MEHFIATKTQLEEMIETVQQELNALKTALKSERDTGKVVVEGMLHQMNEMLEKLRQVNREARSRDKKEGGVYPK